MVVLLSLLVFSGTIIVLVLNRHPGVNDRLRESRLGQRIRNSGNSFRFSYNKGAGAAAPRGVQDLAGAGGAGSVDVNISGSLETASPPPIVHGPFSRKDESILQWDYLLKDKLQAHVGSRVWRDRWRAPDSRYFNSLAVVADEDEDHLHGVVGLYPNGSEVWQPRPTPPPLSRHPDGPETPLKKGGFYLELSEALPVSRPLPDFRDPVCKEVRYDYDALGDASVIITFFNEPMSTLLRSVYSVLNGTPPPLLREIILVDDHSDDPDCVPGGVLYHYINYLPKVKLMRLPERRGLVQARLAGARAARGDVIVVLDSHIEVNRGWLEPQLQVIADEPKALVFPQILGLAHDTFEHKPHNGIGCFLSWRWSIVEQASLTGTVKKPDPLPSPSMAGGLFAIDREYFWEVGGYDEGFVAWGAENVEMAFRIWMCGGKVLCAPCSKTYHIYRKGGAGYSNPPGALWRNRQRTAVIWMDEYYQLARRMIDMSAARLTAIGSYEEAIGDLTKMLKLKRDLNCKSFKWYLENVDPQHDIRDLDAIIGAGRIKSANTCIDLHGARQPDKPVKTFSCHSQQHVAANQAFLITRGDRRVRLMSNDKRCLSLHKNSELSTVNCSDQKKAARWDVEVIERNNSTLTVKLTWDKNICMDIAGNKNDQAVKGVSCDRLANPLVELDPFTYDPDYRPPVYTPTRLRRYHHQNVDM